MRRILVPVDGSELAEDIIPDARRLAGPDGELILVRDVNWIRYDPATGHYTYRAAVERATTYLDTLAEKLRRDGVKVSTHWQTIFDAAAAINAAAVQFGADVVACATHGRGPVGRLLSGGVAWKALAYSRVPVLLRHVNGHTEAPAEPAQRRILVPLDGSPFAEAALPLAAELASEWNAPLSLVRVQPEAPIHRTPFGPANGQHVSASLGEGFARSRLEQITRGLPVPTRIDVRSGHSVVHELIQVVNDQRITDIVVSSHGHVGFERVLAGSVADELIHRLRCPIVILPPFAALKVRAAQESRVERAPVLSP